MPDWRLRRTNSRSSLARLAFVVRCPAVVLSRGSPLIRADSATYGRRAKASVSQRVTEIGMVTVPPLTGSDTLVPA